MTTEHVRSIPERLLALSQQASQIHVAICYAKDCLDEHVDESGPSRGGKLLFQSASAATESLLRLDKHLSEANVASAIYIHSENTLAADKPTSREHIQSRMSSLDSITDAASYKRPSFLTDTFTFGPIHKALAKKFPDIPDLTKIQTFAQMQAQQKEIYLELQPYFDIFERIVELKEALAKVLHDGSMLIGLGSPLTQDLNELLLWVVTKSALVHMAAAELPEKKLLVAGFVKVHSLLHGSVIAPEIQAVLQYVEDFDKPIAAMQSLFSSHGTWLSSIILSLKNDFMGGLVSSDQLRKENTFTLVHGNVQQSQNALDDQLYHRVTFTSRYFTIISVLFLLMPGELNKSQCVDVLKLAFGVQTTTQLTRRECINFASEYEIALKPFPKLAKIKSSILYNEIMKISFCSEAISNSQMQQQHKNTREYLRRQLCLNYHLCVDNPILIQTKLPAILSLLEFARNELVWYFQHFDKTAANKSKTKTTKLVALHDPILAEILHWFLKLRQQCITQEQSVASYYSILLKDTFAPRLREQIQNMTGQVTVDDYTSKILNSTFSELEDWKMERLSSGPTFLQGYRLNWLRLQLAFSMAGQNLTQQQGASVFVRTAGQASYRTQFIDRWQELWRESTSLQPLYEHRLVLEDVLMELLEVHSQTRYIHAIPLACTDFATATQVYRIEEIPMIGRRIVDCMDRMYKSIRQTVRRHLTRYLEIHATFGKQITTEIWRHVELSQVKNPKKGVMAFEARMPGFESSFRLTGEVEELTSLRGILKNFFQSLAEPSEIVVYDAVFQPRQCITEVLAHDFRRYKTNENFSLFHSFLVISAQMTDLHTTPNSPVEEVDVMKRPSVLLNEINAYLNAATSLCSLVHLEVGPLLKAVLMDHCSFDKTRKYIDVKSDILLRNKGLSKKDRTILGHKRTNSSPDSDLLVVLYGFWYIDYIVNNAVNGSVCFAPQLNMFASASHHQLVRPEDFTETHELMALCELLGPEGVRFMEERMIRIASGLISDIKSFLSDNRELLRTIEISWREDVKLSDYLKKLKQLDDFENKSIKLGSLLAFRRLLLRANQLRTSAQYSLLHDWIVQEHQDRPSNIFGQSDALAMDTLANLLGYVERVDILFRTMMDQHCRSDAMVWQYVSIAFALLAVRFTQSDMKYNAKTKGHLNNAHTLPALIADLITYSHVWLHPNDLDAIKHQHLTFLQMATAGLLREWTAENKDLASTFILLEKFYELSPFVTAESWASILPFASYWTLTRPVISVSCGLQSSHDLLASQSRHALEEEDS